MPRSMFAGGRSMKPFMMIMSWFFLFAAVISLSAAIAWRLPFVGGLGIMCLVGMFVFRKWAREEGNGNATPDSQERR